MNALNTRYAFHQRAVEQREAHRKGLNQSESTKFEKTRKMENEARNVNDFLTNEIQTELDLKLPHCANRVYRRPSNSVPKPNSLGSLEEQAILFLTI